MHCGQTFNRLDFAQQSGEVPTVLSPRRETGRAFDLGESHVAERDLDRCRVVGPRVATGDFFAVGSEADEARFNVTMGIESIKGLSGEQLDAAMKTLNDRDFPVFDFARKLEAQVNELMGMLREIAQTPDKARLEIARERFKATAMRIRMELQAAEAASSNAFRGQVVEAVIASLSLGLHPDPNPDCDTRTVGMINWS